MELLQATKLLSNDYNSQNELELDQCRCKWVCQTFLTRLGKFFFNWCSMNVIRFQREQQRQQTTCWKLSSVGFLQLIMDGAAHQPSCWQPTTLQDSVSQKAILETICLVTVNVAGTDDTAHSVAFHFWNIYFVEVASYLRGEAVFVWNVWLKHGSPDKVAQTLHHCTSQWGRTTFQGIHSRTLSIFLSV